MEQEILENLCYLVWDVNNSLAVRALSSSTTSLQFSSIILSLVTCIIGLAANIIVIFVTGFLMKKNKYKIWFLNLARADFTFLLFLPLYVESVMNGKWTYGHSMCKLLNFLTFLNTYAGIYILTALNIDRALSVAKPIWHRRFYSPSFCWCMCAAIWVTSTICSIPAIVYSVVNNANKCSLSYYDTGHFETFLKNHSHHFHTWGNCTNIFERPEGAIFVNEWRVMVSTLVSLIVPLVVFGYVIPLCVILVSNIIIALHVKNSKMAATSRLYRVLIAAVMSFFCTRTPYVLAYIIFLVSLSTVKFTLVYKVSAFLGLLFAISATKSLLNPVVYVLIVKKVRSEVIQFF